MKNILKTFIVTLILFLISAFPASMLFAQEIAKIDNIEGDVTVKLAAESDFKTATKGQALSEQDVIKTGRHGRAGIVFTDGFLLRIAETTTIQLKARSGDKAKEVSVDSGKAYFFSREPKEFPIIGTPAVTTAIRGTEFVVIATAVNTQVMLLDGAVECFNQYGKVALSPGEQSTTKLGEAPVKSILLNPTDAVQWALSYPVVIDAAKAKSPSKDLLKISSLVNEGKTSQALDYFEGLKGKGSPDADLYAANIYLSIGQVEKASSLMEKADRSGNKSPDLLSLSSVISLIKNDKENAKNLADSAYAADNSSASAVLSSAYIAQANFDLEGAKGWYKRLIEIEPENAFAYAKLAELELGSGEFDKAGEYLSTAKKFSPENSFVMTVDGFYRLFKEKTDEAISIFENVIAKDSSLATARLGLGLAKIRKGDVAAGREELKTAAFLEPQTAIYRSYLGKAYFEEENEKMAGHEYDRAIELDPKDPTAYLYRAYNSLSQNRPVSALKDVEKSIELNNNRAVYRSSLLLDQDSGVKSANLAEVFTTLGFAEVARVEAIKSLNKNYTNYSAHRLLADSYQNLFLADSMVSERRLFDLLSPLSFNAFSFRQASDGASLNEYNSLFDRDESRTYIGTELGTGDDLISPSVFHVAKEGDLAYLFGYDGNYTGGSKDNNFLVQNRARVAFQYQPTLEDRFLLNSTGLYRNQEDDKNNYTESKLEQYDIVGGYTHRFSQTSKFLAEAVYANQRNNLENDIAERFTTAELLLPDETLMEDIAMLVDEFTRDKVSSFRGTAQYLYDNELVSFVMGSQIYFSDADRREDSLEYEDSIGLFADIDYRLRSKAKYDTDSQDYYLYTNWHLTDWMDVNLGTTFSHIELSNREFAPFVEGTSNRSKLSPKLGVTLYPTDTTTVRAAYFESLTKSSLEDVGTLEPTLVGGINQRFTDIPGSSTRNFGIGIDQKITNSTYFGVEGLRRHLTDRLNAVDSTVTIDYTELTIDSDYTLLGSFETHSEQNIAKTYIYQVITDETVATLDYQWAGFNQDQDFEEDLDNQVHKIGSTLRYFNKQGWFTFGTATWRDVNKQGDFEEIDGNENFWLVDAGIGYRLPKRHGSIVLQVNNIFDQDFFYDQSIGIEQFVRPETSAALVASFNF